MSVRCVVYSTLLFIGGLTTDPDSPLRRHWRFDGPQGALQRATSIAPSSSRHSLSERPNQRSASETTKSILVDSSAGIEAKLQCHPSSPSGIVEWHPGSRIIKASLPPLTTNECDSKRDSKGEKCNHSSTVHIQEGDSLQVMLQRSQVIIPNDSADIQEARPDNVTTESKLDFSTSEEFVPLTIWKVTKSEWGTCSTREGGQLPQAGDNGVAIISNAYLTAGTHFVIGRSSWSGPDCFQIKVVVRAVNCGEGSLCSREGICYTNSSMDKFVCGCCDGYSGRHCEERNACKSLPCLNSGICLDIQEGHDGDTFQCLCPYGYRGRYCENASSLCDSNPCQNGGFCEGNHTAYLCHCSHGWGGLQCTKKLSGSLNNDSEDDSNHKVNLKGCSNGACIHGVCVETKSNEFKCFCQPGYGGDTCQSEYDECSSIPCHNGGTCINQIGSFQCLCPPGYIGDSCLNKVDLCEADPDPCPFPRMCVDRGNFFTCECLPELTNSGCDDHQDICSPNPCNHGGTCYTIEETLSFYCACRPGFTGQTCQDASILESVGPYGAERPDEEFHEEHPAFPKHYKHMKNLYTGIVTIACAFLIFILVVTICYCKVNRATGTNCLLTIGRAVVQRTLSLRRNSARDNRRRASSSSTLRFDFESDNAAVPMTSNGSGDVYYNMDMCDNQELPLIK